MFILISGLLWVTRLIVIDPEVQEAGVADRLAAEERRARPGWCGPWSSAWPS